MTGWEIFSKLDVVKWTLNQAENISRRVFRLIQGRSIPESNQRGKRNKNHMNPLIQLKKATLLFVIALVLACFTLSPQAFAAPAPTPTFSPNHWCGPKHWKNVTFSAGPPGGQIFVQDVGGSVLVPIPNPTTTPVGYLGTKKLKAFARKPGMTDSGWAYSGTYKYSLLCLAGKVVFWVVIGGILLAAVLIWLFVKRSSASR